MHLILNQSERKSENKNLHSKWQKRIQWQHIYVLFNINRIQHQTKCKCSMVPIINNDTDPFRSISFPYLIPFVAICLYLDLHVPWIIITKYAYCIVPDRSTSGYVYCFFIRIRHISWDTFFPSSRQFNFSVVKVHCDLFCCTSQYDIKVFFSLHNI